MTKHRYASALAATFLTAGLVFSAASAKMKPGTEPDLPELDRLKNVDRRVSVSFENAPAFKVLEAIANAGSFHLDAEGPEDCCHITVALNHVSVRRALETVAGQAGLRYQVVTADKLRVTLPLPQVPTDDTQLPELLTKVEPVYPRDARDARIDGKVVLQVVIRENGTVGDVQVLTAVPGWPSLDRSAVEALRKWTYRPAKKDGNPVSVLATVAVQFRLEEAGQNEDTSLE